MGLWVDLADAVKQLGNEFLALGLECTLNLAQAIFGVAIDLFLSGRLRAFIFLLVFIEFLLLLGLQLSNVFLSLGLCLLQLLCAVWRELEYTYKLEPAPRSWWLLFQPPAASGYPAIFAPPAGQPCAPRTMMPAGG